MLEDNLCHATVTLEDLGLKVCEVGMHGLDVDLVDVLVASLQTLVTLDLLKLLR
jgi:hypothetical protein